MTIWFSLEGSMGGQVLSTGSDNISGLSRDNGAIGVGNESIGVSKGVANRGNGGGDTMSGEVGSFGSSDLRGLGRDNGTVGKSYEATGVVSIPCSIGVSSVGNGGDGTTSSKVGCLSGDNLGGLGGSNSTVGVGDELNSIGSSHASKENLEF